MAAAAGEKPEMWKMMMICNWAEASRWRRVKRRQGGPYGLLDRQSGTDGENMVVVVCLYRLQVEIVMLYSTSGISG